MKHPVLTFSQLYELLETHGMVLFQGLAGHAYSMDRAEGDAALAVLAQLRAYYRGIILRY